MDETEATSSSDPRCGLTVWRVNKLVYAHALYTVHTVHTCTHRGVLVRTYMCSMYGVHYVYAHLRILDKEVIKWEEIDQEFQLQLTLN